MRFLRTPAVVWVLLLLVIGSSGIPKLNHSTEPDLRLRIYPSKEIQPQNAGDNFVVQCRDEGPLRARTTWVREGDIPLRAGSSSRHGRLEIPRISVTDAGVYICQATRYSGYPGSETRVQLNVKPNPDDACQPDTVSCNDGMCIEAWAVCDGIAHCTDGSDEINCDIICGPEQFQCSNRQCVPKQLLCDGVDHCGDNSDEADCFSEAAPAPLGKCLTTEFECNAGGQCINKRFLCNGQIDCLDGSDESYCGDTALENGIVRSQEPDITVSISQPIKTVEEGSNVNFTCQVFNEKTFTRLPVLWTKAEGKLPERRYLIDWQTGSLLINDVRFSDNGTYTCHANDGNNRVTKDFVLNILGQPEHTNNPMTQSLPKSTIVVQLTSPSVVTEDAGKNINFTCQAYSWVSFNHRLPHLHRLPITWMKVDGELPHGRNQIDKNNGLLSLTNIQLSDSGMYVCMTSNGIDMAHDLATLVVDADKDLDIDVRSSFEAFSDIFKLDG